MSSPPIPVSVARGLGSAPPEVATRVAVLALGGPAVAALARAHAPAGVCVRSQEVAGHDPATWDVPPPNAAGLVAAPGVGVCG